MHIQEVRVGMKKFIQYVAIALLIFGAVLPNLGMEVKAAENTDASRTIDYSASLNVLKADPKTGCVTGETSVMVKSGYVKTEAAIKKQNGQYTVDITVPGRFSTWYRGFKVESGGELKEAIKRQKDKMAMKYIHSQSTNIITPSEHGLTYTLNWKSLYLSHTTIGTLFT